MYVIVLATPAVRHLIRTHKLDYSKIVSSGKGGRILKEDVLKYIGVIDSKKEKEIKEGKEILNNTSLSLNDSKKKEVKYEIKSNESKVIKEDTTKTKEKQPQPQPQITITEDKDIPIKITGFKKAMTKSMTKANSIPQFLYHDEYNVDQLIKLRQDTNKIYSDLKFSFLPFIIKAVSNSLLDFPELNSIVLDTTNEEGLITDYIIKSNHNISIAIDGPDGLVVPNIKQVQLKSVKDIQKEILRLKDKAMNRGLVYNDLADGTFSISSIGNIGGKVVSPIIMPPQVCIIGVTKMFEKVIVNRSSDNKEEVLRINEKDIELYIKKYIGFSISADHRVIDGAYVARFSEKVRGYIENSIKILL